MTGTRLSSQPGQVQSVDGRDGAAGPRATRIKRSAWLLAGLALAFYVFYIGWYFWRSTGA